jgi:hypothetical protein
MALYIQVVDAQGHPDPVGSLADVVVEAVVARGVGLFRTSNHVAEDLRAVIHELIRDGRVVQIPPSVRDCHDCQRAVGVWHVYPDGLTLCTECKDVLEASK